MVKISYQWIAIFIVILGVAVAGAYVVTARNSTATAPAASPGGDAATAVPAAAAAGNAKFMHFRVGNRNVKSIFLDGDMVWIGTSGGVIRYQPSTDKETVFDNRVDGILSNGVFHVSKIGDRVFVGTYGGGLSVLDPATQKWRNYNIPDGLADQFVYDVKLASNGDLWIATWSGINRVRGARLDDPSQWDIYTMENTQGGIPNPWVYSADEGPDGTMWFGTEEGLTRFKDGAWRHWKHSDGLGAPYELVRDAIKFTNDPAKASQHHARQKAEQGMDDVKVAYNPNYIISLAVDKQGVIWCGTWGGGLARFDGDTWRNFTTADGLPANHIFMLYIDPADHLWIGTSGGLARMNDDAAGFTVMTTADGLFADNVFSMANTQDGAMWVGSFGGVARIAGH
ncbi:MAG: two component regulator propeller domain-containing protein [Gammaproteobacteria bacterium]|nr:MAG: two component regulator propeller domain-containing protein [Gammaproteobacteria bacterium]TND06203.1 MAG: two component regulator propeller domain-containing protein [Gammaproteobacteria bacterium]